MVVVDIEHIVLVFQSQTDHSKNFATTKATAVATDDDTTLEAAPYRDRCPS